MRLWAEQLIPNLPQKQLCGQWRECIALLGKGFGRKHKTVDYVFKYPEHNNEYIQECLLNLKQKGIEITI